MVAKKWRNTPFPFGLRVSTLDRQVRNSGDL